MTSLTGIAERGLLLNAALALGKLIAGVLGNSYALIADAVESMADLFGSVVVWGGLRISGREADERFPFGYGKAETVATVIVGMLLVGAAVGIGIEAVREIVTPHHAPAPFTLVVLVLVVVVKETWSRRVFRQARTAGSSLVAADAWHHRSDALTSVAAFLGISVALIGGPGWEAADDVAALIAAFVILVNGWLIVRPAVFELMDRSPENPLLEQVDAAARSVPEVRDTEKLRIRKMGSALFVEIHVQSEPTMSLRDAHVVSGKVKTAVRRSVPRVV
ncbi:MAG: cation diffusion facilitator family transporter, partial [Gemmatimonadales bacterium]|nr:cation diffusion facilitator family transporter [Gemmatimonadales bacterium]